MSSCPSAMIQFFGPSVSIIVRYPGGISGSSWPIVRLHTEQGIPVPPQWHASSYRSRRPMVCRDGLHIPNAPRRKPRILIFPSHHALSLFLFRRLWNSKAHGHTVAVMKKKDWRRARTWRNGSGKSVLLRLPVRGPDDPSGRMIESQHV